MTDQYFSSGSGADEHMPSGGQGIKLPDFGIKHGSGFPRVDFHKGNGPSDQWSVYLLGLVLSENLTRTPCGWGESLGDAYDDYVSQIKGRWAHILQKEVLIPPGLIV